MIVRNIAFVGEQCSGKTTASEILCRLGSFWKRNVKFIEPIYKINNLLGVQKNRVFMQELGELIRREFGEDYFILEFKKQHRGVSGLVCDDVRKIIEFETVKELGFVTVFIDAEEEIRRNRAKSLGLEFNPNHPAEKEIRFLRDKCDYIILNNEDNIDSFTRKILRIVTLYDFPVVGRI